MDIPKDAPSGAINRLRAEVARAFETAGNPNPTELEEASILRTGVPKLDAQTIRDFLVDEDPTLMGWERFNTLIILLGAEKAKNWKELHMLAERERNQNALEKRRAAKAEPEPADTVASVLDKDSELEADEPPAKPLAARTNHQLGQPAIVETDDPRQTEVVATTATLERIEQEHGHELPEGAAQPPTPLTPATRPDHSKERRRRRRWVPIGAIATVAILLLVVAGAVIVPKLIEIAAEPATARSSRAGAAEIRRGPETSAGILTWVEAPVDGSMVGQAKPMADTIGLWSQPSQSCDQTALSPCIPGSVPAGKVTLPATVRVVCVTDGQTIRNGAPGASGYYEDNRWLRTAPDAAVEGTGYLSNVWFARDRLPANLARCPR